jgi:flagellar hook-associated protein FlgK
LSATINEFFNALQDLSAHPGEAIWQNQAVTTAEAMAARFRTLGEFLTALEDQIKLEAENTIDQINTLINQIAELNDEIETIEVGGAQANNLRDKRDQYITKLSEFIGVETISREYGVVDVTAAGIPVVIGASTMELEVGFDENNELGLTVVGVYSYNTDVQGGRLGGLLSLRNELVADIHNNLDDLVSAIVQQINQYHVQGVGTSGSFTGLTGWVMADEDLADFDPAVTDGKIYIRVTNTSTEVVTRNKIDIDASTDSLTSIAADISAIDGLTASVVSSKLSISTDANYKFDFLPGVLSGPTTNGLTGGSVPNVSISADMLTYLNADDGASNEIQTITTTDEPDGGDYTLSFGGDTTGTIAHGANAAVIKSALVAGISTISTDDIDVTGGPIGASTPIVITFKGTLAGQDVGDITIDASSLTTGGSSADTPTVTEAKQGHAASGLFTGSANRTYTCTVVGTGDVGVESSLQIQVKIGTAVVKTVSVGSGYAAGDRLDIGDGLFISIGAGTLNDGEEFTIEALANSDTSGVLAAVGINTFFYGGDASNMAVCSDIAATPGRVATALGADMTDNANASRLAGLSDQAVSTLSAMTPEGFYHRMITDIGQELSVKQMRRDNIEVMVQNLLNQQSEVSGVDINDEAAQLLIFEQMFQAMAKYMSTIQSTVAALMAAM